MSDKNREIGKILAAARREQEKSIKDVSEDTKIMEQYVEALEAGEAEKLPSDAYFQLFSRSYAEYLGIDPLIFEEIDEKRSSIPDVTPDDDFQPPDDEETNLSESQAQARKFGRSLIYLVSVIFIIFIAFLGYNFFFVKGDGNLFEQITGESSVDENLSSAEENQNQPELIIPDEPYQAPEKLKLYLRAKQEVWAVIARDGDTVMNRKLVAGAERQWEANYRYHLTIGISTAVDLFVNDLKLAPLSDRARTISGLEINQINYKDFYPPPVSEEDDVPVVPAASANETTTQPTETSDPVIEDNNSAGPSSEDTADGS